MGKTQRREEQATVRMDGNLKQAIAVSARSLGVSQNVLMVDAIRRYVREKTADQAEAEIAPLLSEIVTGTVRSHATGQRRMTVRLAYEVLRLQYVLCEFMVQAGISAGHIETWRSDGWTWAVKVFKQQPAVDEEGVT
ncbi:MAG TPA: hypothetical protein VD902_11535 [Symbiobacteriaceae bacterium]|nr:hypothetical protein [Symbiobacteriaceae bacterium]